jgi:hypothetical protein
MRTLMLIAAVVTLPACLPGGFFFLVSMPGVANRPEVCESCKVEGAAVDRLADAVPGWMEESRTRLGPTATVDRTGHFSWELSLEGRAVSKCGARMRAGWHCEPL